MTQPAGDGAPGAQPTAPAPTTAPGAPAAPANTGPTSPAIDASTPIDFDSLPPNVKKHIADLRQEAGAQRQGKTAAEKQRDGVLKALGLNPDGSTASPEEAVNQLTQRATAAEEAAWGAMANLAVFQLAATLGANAEALLDSNTFVNSLDELVDTDPNSAVFKSALEAKISAALASNPNLRSKVAAAGRSSGEFPGGAGAGTPITEEQLARMTPDEITKALGEGRLAHLL